MHIEHRHPWLIADLGVTVRTLSWAPYRSGFVEARQVVWREVRNADLTRDFDAVRWLADEMAEARMTDAVGLLTSRNLASHHVASATVSDVTADALATVGLGNAERVGRRVGAGEVVGTINVLVHVDHGLTDSALVEALSIATEARTAAVLNVGHRLSTGEATGTGTDCVVVAALPGNNPHAGKHTAVGEALGAAVYEAVLAGAKEWMAENA